MEVGGWVQWVGGWVGGWMGGWMGGWVGGWVNGLMSEGWGLVRGNGKSRVGPYMSYLSVSSRDPLKCMSTQVIWLGCLILHHF